MGLSETSSSSSAKDKTCTQTSFRKEFKYFTREMPSMLSYTLLDMDSGGP